LLEELRPDEVAFLQKLIRVMISFGIVGGAIIGLVIGLPLLIDTLMRIWSWFPRRGP
jgi:fucose permease